MKLRMFVVIATIATAPSALAQGVFRGPILNHVTGDAVTVVWESPAPTTGVVRYGAPGALMQMAASNTPARHHEVRLTGLAALTAPGGQIAYELDIGGTIHAGTFRTMVQGAAPFSFIVYGDNRSSPQQHQVVVDALLQEMPTAHFAINTGDLVSNGEEEGDWDLFFPVAAPFLASMPLYVAIGNHEVDRGGWDVTRRIFVMPTDVPPASNEEGFFHVIYGNVQLIILNVEVDHLYTVALLRGAQEDWLEQILMNRPAGVDHRFIFLHQGPYSSKTGRNGNFWLRQWLDQFAAAGIDVIFSGHDHYAERGFAKNGIYYVIHGGGGAPLYDTQGVRVTNDHTIVHSESRLGYIRVDIDGTRAHVATKGIGGEVIDEFTYGDTASPGCNQASDCGSAPANGCPGGAWACERSACRFACPMDSGGLVACVTDSACEDSIGATCAGTPSCEHPSINPTSWYCDCVLPPECSVDMDCAARPSPIPGCTGTWACVDEQCEFTTIMCTPVPDAGPSIDATVPPDPDSGVAVDPDAAVTVEDASAASNEDATTGGPAVDAGSIDPSANDSGSGTTGGVIGTEDAKGCGCTIEGEHPQRSALGLIILLASVAAARRARGDRDSRRCRRGLAR